MSFLELVHNSGEHDPRMATLTHFHDKPVRLTQELEFELPYRGIVAGWANLFLGARNPGILRGLEWEEDELRARIECPTGILYVPAHYVAPALHAV